MATNFRQCRPVTNSTIFWLRQLHLLRDPRCMEGNRKVGPHGVFLHSRPLTSFLPRNHLADTVTVTEFHVKVQ
jgi:hypothetical protein